MMARTYHTSVDAEQAEKDMPVMFARVVVLFTVTSLVTTPQNSFLMFTVTVDPAPASVRLILAPLLPAVSTRSFVRVPSVARVTYWASVGAPDPELESVVPDMLRPVPRLISCQSPDPESPRPSSLLAAEAPTMFESGRSPVTASVSARSTAPKPRVPPERRSTWPSVDVAISATSPVLFALRPTTEVAPLWRNFALDTAFAAMVVARVPLVVTSPDRSPLVMLVAPENLVRLPLAGDPVVVTVPPPAGVPHVSVPFEAMADTKSPEVHVRGRTGLLLASGRVKVRFAPRAAIVTVVVLPVPRVSWLVFAVSVSLANVGVAAVWRFCGVESTTVEPAPLSVMVTWFAVPVSTRSFVSVPLVARVTYWASAGAPPPPEPQADPVLLSTPAVSTCTQFEPAPAA